MAAIKPLSVVIPCYNAERHIAAAIASVLAQGDLVDEVIIVDDGSTDGSADLVAQRFPQVRLLRQRNAGVANARNNGVANARGEWIAFIDADDVWLPGKLAAQSRVLAGNKQARMSYTAWHVWASDDPQPPTSLIDELLRTAEGDTPWTGASGWIYTDLLLDCAVWTSTVVMHKPLFDELGGFDPQLRLGEDYDLWLRASRVTPILRVAAPLALYRSHPTSITRRAAATNFQGLVLERALARWGFGGPDGQRARRSEVMKALARTWVDFADAHLGAGNLEQARKASVNALHRAPLHIKAWRILLASYARSMREPRAANP